jgi:flagellar biosynthesis/type III secretory pathway protein FliH
MTILHVPAVDPATVEEMRRLVSDLDGQHRREQAAFAEGFRLGYADGFDIGHGQAHRELAEDWHRVYQTVQTHARMRTWAEILRNRKEVA